MRFKKANIVFGLVIMGLLLLIGISVINILGIGAKEVSVARKFVEELHDNGIIEKNNSIENDDINEEVLNKLTSKNSRIKHSVIIGNYGVDIDKDYNILGFSNKNLVEEKYSTEKISENEAISLAEKYISQITKDEFSFKEIKSNEDSKLEVYNIVFYKYKNGYPCYQQEINTLINKITGKLEGYTNYTLEIKEYIDDINIDEKKAIEILRNNFNSLDINASIEEKPVLAYINISDEKMVLAYIFNVKVIISDNKEETISYFVRSDNGEIINYNLEAITLN